MLTKEQHAALKRARLNIQLTADKVRYTADWNSPAIDNVRTLSEALVALHMAEDQITKVRQELLADIMGPIVNERDK